MISARFLGGLYPDLACPYQPGLKARDLLAAAGLADDWAVAFIVDGRLAGPEDEVPDGASVVVVPPLYGG